ncbi:P-loop containing nucleoside triphosphate hydrolase protein [Aspergillus falconensis]
MSAIAPSERQSEVGTVDERPLVDSEYQSITDCEDDDTTLGDEETAQQLVKTRPTGVPGVDYDLTFAQKLDQSGPKLAGALGMKDTAELRNLWADASTRAILKTFCTERKKVFGWKDASNQQLTLKPMLNLFTDPTVAAVLWAPTPPVKEMPQVTAQNFVGLCTCWYAIRLMKTVPALFGRTQWDGAGVAAKINPLDALHAWKTLSFFYRLHEKKYIDTKYRVQPAHPVLLHRPAGGTTTITAKDTGAIPKTYAELYGLSAEEMAKRLDALEKTTNLQIEATEDEYARLEQLAETLSGVVAKSLSNDGGKAAMVRPPISVGDRAAVIKSLLRGPDNFMGRCIIQQGAAPSAGAADNTVEVDLDIANTTAAGDAVVAVSEHPITDADDLGKEMATVKSMRDELVRASAAAPPVKDACGVLGLDPSRPRLQGDGQLAIDLKPYQVTGMIWMRDQERGPIKGGILADDCGLGKTRQGCGLVWARTRTRESSDARFKPTLVVAPGGVLPVWIRELRITWGGQLTFRIYYRSRAATTDLAIKALTLEPDELAPYVKGLDARDPATAKTLILTSYETWSIRTTKEANSSEQTVAAGSIEEHIDTIATIQDDLDAVKTMTPKGQRQRWESTAVGLFDRVILDEGHKVKNINTRQHQSIALLQAQHIWIFSATPMLNQMVDLGGYLALMHQADWDTKAASAIAEAGGDPLQIYLDAEQTLKTTPNTDITHLLSPWLFSAVAHKDYLKALSGHHALPLVLRQICLARAKDDPVDPTTVKPGETYEKIGDSIPPLEIQTIDLCYPPYLQKEHDAVYNMLVRKLKTGGGSVRTVDKGGDAKEGNLNMGILRQLALVGFCPRLDDFITRAGHSRSMSREMAKNLVGRRDRGFSWFWQHTSRDRLASIPVPRAHVAAYLAGECPKLRYLSKILQDEGALQATVAPGAVKHRFLVFCRYPLCAWMVEMFLDALCVPFTTIKSSMDMEERASNAALFTNPAAECTVLVTTFACGALGLNLHDECARAILLETPANFNTLLQAIGRVHRIGQQHAQRVYILFQDHTISRYLEAKNTAKHIPQLAMRIPPAEVAKAKAKAVQALGSDGEEDNDHEAQSRVREAENAAVEELADAALRRQLGQATSRLRMGDVENLYRETAVPKSQATPIKRRFRNMGGSSRAQKRKRPAGTETEKKRNRRERKRAGSAGADQDGLDDDPMPQIKSTEYVTVSDDDDDDDGDAGQQLADELELTGHVHSASDHESGVGSGLSELSEIEDEAWFKELVDVWDRDSKKAKRTLRPRPEPAPKPQSRRSRRLHSA